MRLARCPKRAMLPPRMADHTSETAPRGTLGRVLAIDDDESYARLAAQALRPDYELLQAKSTAEGLRLLEQHPVDLIVAAHPMAELTGLKLLREALRRYPRALRVVTTELQESKVLIEAINDARVCYILRKPWGAPTLREVIDGLMGLRHAEGQRLQRFSSLDGDASYKESLTGVLSLPGFFRRLQRSLLVVQPELQASLLCAAVDDEVEDKPRSGFTPTYQEGVGAKDSPEVRLLAACVLEAAGRFPNSHVAKTDARILAFVPGCSAAEAVALGEQVAANFARATQVATAGTASVGVASFPRHATNGLRLIDLAYEALLRARRTGRGQVRECLPRLVVVGPLAIFNRMISSLTRRPDLVLRVLERPDELDKVLEEERPGALVVNVLGPRSVLDQIQQARKKPQHQRMQVILASNKDETPQLAATAARVPGAQLIAGSARLGPRIVEAVGVALGIRQRRTHRREVDLSLQVVIAPASTNPRTVSGKLANISETGALVVLPEKTLVGEALQLSLAVSGKRLELRAHVARLAKQEPGAFECGVRFEPMGDEESQLVLRLVTHVDVRKEGGETHLEFRSGRRFVPSKPVRIKARLKEVGQKAVTYVKVANLAEGGFLAVSAPKVCPAGEVGSWVEAMVFDGSSSFRCTAQVMHRTQDEHGCHKLGFQFVQLDRDARSMLKRLLARCEELR